MSTLTTRNGVELYYDDWGSGRPVVLMGTAMMDSRMWEYLAPTLAAEGFRAVAYDRRGCGRSDRPWDGYDYETLADDLADLMEHLDLRNATLFGYAVGGGESVSYLSRYGSQRVDQLALVASTTPFMLQAPDNPDGLDPALFEQMTAPMIADRPRWMGELAATFFGDGGVSPEFAEWIVRVALDCSPRAGLEIYRTLFVTDLRAETAKVDVPTLIVHGDADQGAPWPLCGQRTAELIPHAETVLYPGAAHGLFATHAGQLATDLLSFLRTGSARKSGGEG